MKKKLTNKHNGAVLVVNDTQIAIYGGNCVLLDTSYRFSLLEWELSDYEEKPPLYYIRGNKERGDEVIKMLREKGGNNPIGTLGNREDWFFFIDTDNNISYCDEHSNFAMLLQRYGTELHLPELPEKKEDIMQQALRTEYEKGRADVIEKLKKFLDSKRWE